MVKLESPNPRGCGRGRLKSIIKTIMDDEMLVQSDDTPEIDDDEENDDEADTDDEDTD